MSERTSHDAGVLAAVCGLSVVAGSFGPWVAVVTDYGPTYYHIGGCASTAG